MLNKKRNKKKGFTLIELVIVLAVLAIIALIAIPNFNKVREDSQKKADARSLEAIEKIVDMEIIEGNIADNEANKKITISKNAAGKFAVDTGAANTTITIKNIANVDAGLTKVEEPQEKNKKAYEITVNQGEVVGKKTI